MVTGNLKVITDRDAKRIYEVSLMIFLWDNCAVKDHYKIRDWSLGSVYNPHVKHV